MNFGTLNFLQLLELTPFLGSISFIFIIISFLFKLSIAPFHFWTPDVYQGVLYPITGFFTIFPKFILLTFFIKLYLTIVYIPYLNYIFFMCGLLSVLIGTFNGFQQINLKRLLAYSTISNAGYFLILLAVGSPISIEFTYFYIITYVVANIGVFTILNHMNITNLIQLRNIFETNKLYGLLFALPIFSLAGLPPLVGFLSKYLTIYIIFQEYKVIAAILLLFSIISLFYYLRIVHFLYFYNEPNKNGSNPDKSQGYVVIIVNILLISASANPSYLILLSFLFYSIMDDKEYGKQIEQMCNFILQEASEKANEIKVKTDHDFSLAKQMLVHNAKLKLQQEFKQKEKDFEVQKRIRKSVAIGEARVKKMVTREGLVQEVKEEAAGKLAKIAAEDQGAYKELLRKLIVQGLIKLNESQVIVMCREVDAKTVGTLLDSCSETYKTMIKEACNEDVKCSLTLNQSKFLPTACAGGVKMVAMNGRIVLDNTLDSRLSIAFHDLMPTIRSTLFSTSV